MPDYSTLNFECESAIAHIRLNRPNAANSLNSDMARELKDVARHCDDRSDVKAILLSAEGKFFCVGGDLKEVSSHGDGAAAFIKTLADDLHAAISTFARSPAPLVIAVNGMAAGAGFSMAAAGDIVIAGESASFTMAYSKAGLSPDGSASYYLPRLIGLRRTQELMLTNRRLGAGEALDWGIVTKVVPNNALMETAQDYAAALAAGPRIAHRQIKSLLLNGADNALETQMEIEGRAIGECVSAPDGAEGIAAFLEKRAPKFQ